MEIRMDAVPGETPPPDTFVSMRVGDVQKQTRFEKSRTYRFPNPEDARGGIARIEVFKRIGTMTVPLDAFRSDGEEPQEEVPVVNVPCSFPNFNRLSVRLDVKSAQGKTTMSPEKTLPAPESPKKSRAKNRLDAAQQYLTNFNIEEQLADAMRFVIRDRPADPYTYLSDLFLKQGSGTMQFPRSINSTMMGSTLGSLPEMALSPKALGPVALSPCAEVLPFSSYYKSNFQIMTGDPAAKLFSNFHSKPVAIPQPVAAALPMATMQPVDASQPMATPQPESTSAPAAGGMRAQTPDKFSLKPSVGSWCRPTTPQPVQKLYKPFDKLPSVGTWLAPTPVEPPTPLPSVPLGTSGASRPQLPVSKEMAAASSHLAGASDSAVFEFLVGLDGGTRGRLAVALSSYGEGTPWYYAQKDVGEHTEYVKSLQQLISDKDAELAKLKADLATLSAKVSA